MILGAITLAILSKLNGVDVVYHKIRRQNSKQTGLCFCLLKSRARQSHMYPCVFRFCKSWWIQWSVGEIWGFHGQAIQSYECNQYIDQWNRPEFVLCIDSLLGSHVPTNWWPWLPLVGIVDYLANYGYLVLVHRSGMSPTPWSCIKHTWLYLKGAFVHNLVKVKWSCIL